MLSQNPTSPVNIDVGDIETLRNLILTAKQGNPEAFGVVYTTLYTPLYRYVLSRIRTTPEAEDICQQAFLKFYIALPTYEPIMTPLAYLITIAKRLMINLHHKQSALPTEFHVLDGYQQELISVYDELDSKHLAEKIDSFIPYLTQDEQDVIRLFFYAELTHKEIADALDREEAYIRKIKERALKKIRLHATNLHEGTT